MYLPRGRCSLYWTNFAFCEYLSLSSREGLKNGLLLSRWYLVLKALLSGSLFTALSRPYRLIPPLYRTCRLDPGGPLSPSSSPMPSHNEWVVGFPFLPPILNPFFPFSVSKRTFPAPPFPRKSQRWWNFSGRVSVGRDAKWGGCYTMFVLHRLSLFSGVLFAEFEAVKESAFLLMIVLLLGSFLFLRSVARRKFEISMLLHGSQSCPVSFFRERWEFCLVKFVYNCCESQ